MPQLRRLHWEAVAALITEDRRIQALRTQVARTQVQVLRTTVVASQAQAATLADQAAIPVATATWSNLSEEEYRTIKKERR